MSTSIWPPHSTRYSADYWLGPPLPLSSLYSSQPLEAKSKIYNDEQQNRTRNSPNDYSYLSSPTTSTSTTSIKEESDEDGFVIESFSPTSTRASPIDLSSPTLPSFSSSHHSNASSEVPLRATQACTKMRAMMGVFRLNPFSMHSGGGGAEAPTWDGGEAGPLKEEPTLYDFEVQLYPGALGLDDYDDNDGGGGLRSFSPDFEIDNGSGGEEECVREEGGVWASSFGDVSITSPRKWAQSPSNSHLPVQPRLAPLIMWGQPQGGQCGTGVGGHASHSHSPSPELQYPSSCDIIPFPTSTSVRTSTRHHQRAPTTLATVASSYVAHHQSAMPIGQSTGPLSHHQQSPQSQIDTWHHPQSTNADHSSHHHMHDHGSAVVPAEAYASNLSGRIQEQGGYAYAGRGLASSQGTGAGCWTPQSLRGANMVQSYV